MESKKLDLRKREAEEEIMEVLQRFLADVGLSSMYDLVSIRVRPVIGADSPDTFRVDLEVRL